MTDAERDTYLRRFRFPKELETAFRFDYYQRTVPALRIGLVLLTFILIGQVVGWYVQSNATGLQARALFRPVPILAMFGLTFWPGFWRYWQGYFVALVAVGAPAGVGAVGVSLGAGFWRAPAAGLGYLAMLTLYGMVMLTGVLRLQFAWTAISQLCLVTCSLYAVLTYLPLPPANTLQTYGYIILPALVMVLFASYTHERLQRTAFINHHLLETERRKSEAILRNTLPDPIVDHGFASFDGKKCPGGGAGWVTDSS